MIKIQARLGLIGTLALTALLAGCLSPVEVPPGREFWRLPDGRVGAEMRPRTFLLAESIAAHGVLAGDEPWESRAKEDYFVYSTDSVLGWMLVKRSANILMGLTPLAEDLVEIQSAWG